MAERIILHLDMDAFYASLEQREDPALRGKPVIVGHPGARGVVTTCSYEARPFGVRSALPSVTAARLCPQAIWVEPHFALYESVSERIFTFLAEAVPVVEQVSIDEAYGDLTGAVRDFDAAADLARRIKARIVETERITASIGLAGCRFVAKVASDMEKPDGLTVIPPADAVRRLGPLGVRVIPGVGPKMAERLAPLGVRTVADLAAIPRGTLERRFGVATAEWLVQRARGEDDTPVQTGHVRKQISEERTYAVDLDGDDAVEAELFARAQSVAAELRRRGWLARTVTLKVRDARFETLTRSRTLDEPVDLAADLFETARALWRALGEFRRRPIRLVGLGTREFVTPAEIPPTLFPDVSREKAREVARAADRLREKFGDEAVRPARMIEKPPER